MKIGKDKLDTFLLHVNRDELLIINNALNEVCNGLPLRDFETRMGAHLPEVESLLSLVGQALERKH